MSDKRNLCLSTCQPEVAFIRWSAGIAMIYAIFEHWQYTPSQMPI